MAQDRLKLLADSLARAKSAAKKDILQSSEISRTDRERLLRHSYLKEIVKGWYLLTLPHVKEGESTAWYASFWKFLEVYLTSRFGNQYCLSAESSLEVHLGSNIIPDQVVVITERGGQSVLNLPHNTSLLMYADKNKLPKQVSTVDGLIVMSLPLCLCRIKPVFFEQCPRNAEIALRLVRSGLELSRALVEGGYKSAAERLIGAYQFLNDKEKAQMILDNMKAAGFRIIPKNPFETEAALLSPETRIISPYAARIEALWKDMRDEIISVFPEAPGLPKDTTGYSDHIDEIYKHDAYNSLSIEGYRVTQELIEKVRTGAWDPNNNPYDKTQVDALAAKGYLEAFKTVKVSISNVFGGDSPGRVVSSDLQKWYRALFSPFADAGIIKNHDLIGYRNDRVFIKDARHVPPPHTAVLDSMEILFSLLEEESEAGVRAIMGHFLLVFIHPYMDGNGRIARFLMNIMLASGGYSWTIIRLIRRSEYISALDKACVEGDIKPLAEFIREEMQVDWDRETKSIKK